ncbi:AbrB/MazE/SpoVT family DNA-binding domain-containing protein [Candidatus Poriferisodalis sp.]|uniref:AbrB/MazE/SpoVT family DNA-binding domain-containing protein n=1 Tax=Candidatus Poriferisodalis sp. TaxID=3101277 RepID=UPI003B52D31A
MQIMARVTSKGQVTIPKSVREALGISPGDAVLFRVESERAVMKRIPDLIELAGSVEVPVSKRNMPWEEVIAEAREAWAREAMDIDES